MVGIFALFSIEQVEAQPRPHDSYTFTLDTLTNTGTVNFDYPYVLQPSKKGGLYSLSFQLESTQLTGTSDATCTLWQSNSDTPSTTDWALTTSTADLDATEDEIIEVANFYGAQTRCSCVGTGTQSTQLKVILRVIQKE